LYCGKFIDEFESYCSTECKEKNEEEFKNKYGKDDRLDKKEIKKQFEQAEHNLYMGMEIDSPEDALKMIRAIGLDYDGYRSAENLMDLIDELCDIARTGLYKGKSR